MVGIEDRFTKIDHPILLPPKPNPFRFSAAISYALPKPAKVQAEIFAVTGKKVKILFQGEAKPGIYTLKWKGKDNRGLKLPGGIYFLKFTTDDFRATMKLIRTR